ncbi:MAG: hypothetical protein ABEJ68_03295 [Halobacteriaceae archaeon]
MSDESDPQTEATRSRRERDEHVRAILDQTESMLEEAHKYPIRGEELATEYADQELDLPNETEWLGDVFDRLSDRYYEDPTEAREAVLNELTGEADDEREFNDQRELSELAEQEVEGVEESPEPEADVEEDQH